jgi:serine/threonine-protein kinase
MELLAGEDLEARLAREGRLAPAAMLELLGQVVKALGHAHQVGLVHRDLKPANIFLAQQGGELIVKLLDFGIAKDMGLGLAGNATRTGTLLGSPRYMSPEQVRRSKQIDHRSDLWSLGVILFECLTGRPPFPGQEIGDLLVEICTADIPVASQIAPGLGAELDRFFARALERPPELRFQSAQELAAAFAAAVASSGATAPQIARAVIAAQGSSPPAAAGGEGIAHGALTPPAGQGSSPPAAPGVSAGGGTLAPSGGSLVTPPHRARGILMTALTGALLAGGVVFALIRLIPAGGVGSTAPGAPAALPSPAAPEPLLLDSPSSEPTPEPAPTGSAEAEPRAPLVPAPGASSAAPASPRPSASAAPRHEPTSPPRAPASSKPRRPAHDPLDRL